jgi:hypothetical protein
MERRITWRCNGRSPFLASLGLALAGERQNVSLWRGEVAYGQYNTVREQYFESLTEAAKIVAASWRGGIDGIPIDGTG